MLGLDSEYVYQGADQLGIAASVAKLNLPAKQNCIPSASPESEKGAFGESGRLHKILDICIRPGTLGLLLQP